MTESFRFRRILVSAVGAAAVVAMVPGVGLAAHAIKDDGLSKIGTVSYDAPHQTLVVPVEGPSPLVQLRKLAARQYVADLANSVLLTSDVQGQRLNASLLAGWSLDEAPAGHTVRLRLTLNDDIRPYLQVSREASNLLVHFDGPLSKAGVGVVPSHEPLQFADHRAPAPSFHAEPGIFAAWPAWMTEGWQATKSALMAAETTLTAWWGRAESYAMHWRQPAAALAAAPAKVADPSTMQLGASAPAPVTKPTPMAVYAAHPATPHAPAVASKPAAAPQAKLAVAPKSEPPKAPQTAPHAAPANQLAAASAHPAAPVAAPPVAKAPAAKPALFAGLPAPRTPHVSAPHAPVQLAEAPGYAHLDVARFDQDRHMLVVPFSGTITADRLHVVQLNQHWAYLDVPNARTRFTGVRFANLENNALSRWVMARRPSGTATRVSLELGSPSDVAVKLEGKQILLAVAPRPVMLGQAKPSQPAPISVAAKPETPKLQPKAQPLPTLAARPEAPKLPTLTAASVTDTALARPYYDESRYSLVVPYQGTTPRYRWVHQDDNGVALDLRGDLASAEALVQRFSHHQVMASWKVTPAASPGIVRVEMKFSRAAELVVAADTARKQLMLIPQPRLSESLARASAPQTTLETVQRDNRTQQIVIPFHGQVPSYTVEQVSPTFAYVTFAASKLSTGGVQFYAPDFHPSLNYWLCSERPQSGSVRLALALTQPGAAKVYRDQTSSRLVVVIGSTAPVVRGNGRPDLQQPARWIGQTRPAAFHPELPAPISLSRRAS